MIHTVLAFRYGDRESPGAYVVGVAVELKRAVEIAEAEEDFRGGKYICEVREFTEGKHEDGNVVRSLDTSKWWKIVRRE